MSLPLISPRIIDSFSGEYAFLSNFYIEPDGTHVEGEYQSMKTIPNSLHLRDMKPGQAKRAGAQIKELGKLRPDWFEISLDLMEFFVTWKFLHHPELTQKLLDTGDAVLIEGNNWGDTFWGQVDGKGDNHLGKILMKVRSGIRKFGREELVKCLS